MKGFAYGHLKDQIIVHVLNYIESKDIDERNIAITKLKKLATFYKVKPKRCQISGCLMDNLKNFILNGEGYKNTINKLYNSLHIEDK